jgi:O-antigen/teichoic acid export membrane protein
MAATDHLHNSDKIDIKPDRISRNSLWIFLGLAGNASIYLVTIFFLTRYLGPEKFGFYSVALSLAGLFFPLADMGFDLHMTRMISANPQSLRQELSRTISAKIIFAAVFWFLTLFTAYSLDYSPALVGYTALIGFSLAVGSMAQAYIGAIRALQKMRYESTSLFAGKIVTMIGILLLIAMKASLTLIMIAHIAGSITVFISAVYFLKSQIGEVAFRFSLAEFRIRLKGALPFGLSAIFVAVYFKIDTVMLSKMVEASQVGLYNAAYNIVLASMILSTPLVVAIFPVLASVYSVRRDEADQVFHEGLKYSLIIAVPLGAGILLMVGPLVRFAYGAEFGGSAELLMIIGGTIPLIFATNLMGHSLGAAGYQSRVAIVALFNAVFNIVLNLILIPRTGARGAAIATVSTEALGLIQLLFMLKGIYRISIVPDLLKICLSCFVSAVAFALFKGGLGAWPAAAFFALVYAALAFSLRLISIPTLKGMLFSGKAD